MGKIRVLDKRTAELIAAGEVVERPSSVIKELFENAIDAGATAVTVEIENGGITRMRITDNGSGMAREDVPVAFLRHATSKVRTERDLENIGTLGFRGEALASIAAVARVELTTRTEEDVAGTRYVIEGGEEVVCEDVGCAKGTTITVTDLFYNVPARMKFLKKDVGEGNAVAGVLDRLALSHPEVSVRFIRDGKETLFTAGNGDIHACIHAVFGREFASGLLPLRYESGGITVYGFINKPEYSRPNRTMQHFFVNGRYVKTRTGMAALEQAYKGSLMVGRFPTCVLYVELPLQTVDVNVHPAKIEVRFINEKPLFDAIYYGVKTALSNNTERKAGTLPTPPAEKDRPTVDQLHFARAAYETAPLPKRREAAVPSVPAKPSWENATGTVLRDGGRGIRIPRFQPDIVCTNPIDVTPPAEEKQAEVPSPATPITAEEDFSKPSIAVVGEAFDTYIFAEMNGDLYVIDKHAAHERLLYNRLRAEEHVEAQQLLAPVSVRLSAEEYDALLTAGDSLAAAGFEVEDFGGSEVLVRGLPMMLASEDPSAVIREIAGGLASGRQELTTDRLDWLYHTTACRAAVKAGNRGTPAERQWLAEQVLWNEDIRTCPHGRPVCFVLTRREIEKQFGRVK